MAAARAVASFVVTDGGREVGYAHWCIGGDDEGGIDLLLAPEAQGRGLGPDAAQALVEHLFQKRNWSRVTVDPEARNTRAVRAWQKAGSKPSNDGARRYSWNVNATASRIERSIYH